MKKFVVAILAILYLGTSISATIHLHYCMDELVGWGLWHSNSSTCGTCGMEKGHKTTDDGCCKDEYKYVKNTTDQKTTDNTIQTPQGLKNAAPSFCNNEADHFSNIPQDYSTNHAPPIKSGVEILLRNCVFRI
ncbi:MAG TPA: hypothetical protein VFP97_06625 [Chitinophagaceae bacterium]|nr:hypothetical protein [Chitinophagaceae bacterium]